MAITAAQVKDLRDQTGAGMMDAKKALVENNGDVEAAVDWLRTKGLAKAAKKAGRTAAEGLVAVAVSSDAKSAAVVEINAETDFVARNEQFQGFVKKAAEIAVSKADDFDSFAAADFGNGKSVADSLTSLVATIGENMALRRMEKLTVENGVVASYVHNALTDGLGKIGVIVALESTADQAVLQDLGKKIAMHAAAARPIALNIEGVSDELIEREKAVLREQALESGKPADIVEKMLQGRIRKFYEEIVLLEQTFVMDGENKIAKVVENAAKEAGTDIVLKGFARFELGEGIEKEETDFAAEVAAAANG